MLLGSADTTVTVAVAAAHTIRKNHASEGLRYDR